MSWGDVPTLSGAHVTLRPMLPEDREAILAASEDGRAWGLFYTNAPGPDTIDRWMATALEEQGRGRAMAMVVVRDGAIVGTTGYLRMNAAHRRVEIGRTFYAASVRRSGVNTDAKRLLLGHAFEALDCQCVQFRTDWFNTASQAAIERLGARRDGVLRGHIVMRDGRVRETVCYSILAGEWPGVKANLDHLLRKYEGQGL